MATASPPPQGSAPRAVSGTAPCPGGKAQTMTAIPTNLTFPQGLAALDFNWAASPRERYWLLPQHSHTVGAMQLLLPQGGGKGASLTPRGLREVLCPTEKGSRGKGGQNAGGACDHDERTKLSRRKMKGKAGRWGCFLFFQLTKELVQLFESRKQEKLLKREKNDSGSAQGSRRVV